MEQVIGLVLVALGAVAATVITRTLPGSGPRARLALAVAPTGVLIGAGAALARGWSLVPSAVIGMVLVTVVAVTTGLRIRGSERASS